MNTLKAQAFPPASQVIAMAVAAVVFAQTAHTGCAELFDWPQWQGADRNGSSKEKGLLQAWPKDGPPLAWKVAGLGGGDSAPAVAGGRIYGMSGRGGDEVVWALSEKDGKEIWATRLGAMIQQKKRLDRSMDASRAGFTTPHSFVSSRPRKPGIEALLTAP
jgi:hypothetical protein